MSRPHGSGRRGKEHVGDGPPGPAEGVVLSVVVNGESRRVPGPATLLDLLAHLRLDARTVVVELNRVIIRRPDLGLTPVADGDAIELVHFVGGG